MKHVDVAFKKIEIAEYYSQLDQVRVRIIFDDGQEKALLRQVTITDPDKHVHEWLTEIRAKLKDIHTDDSDDYGPLAGHVVLRFAQEQDVIHERMARFLGQTKERIRSGKIAKLSYFDMERRVSGFSMTFS